MNGENLALALLTLGGLLLLIGVVGGNFRALDAEIPHVRIVPRMLALLLSPLFIVGSAAVWWIQPISPSGQPLSTMTPSAVAVNPAMAPTPSEPAPSGAVVRIAAVLDDTDLLTGVTGFESTVSIDGTSRGLLSVDPLQRSASMDLRLDRAGLHEFSLPGTIVFNDTLVVPFTGQGTFDVSDRAVFALQADASGQMGLTQTGRF